MVILLGFLYIKSLYNNDNESDSFEVNNNKFIKCP